MTIYYQFSGPSNEDIGFDNITLSYLIKDCSAVKNVLVIASDLDDHDTTDYYYNKNLPWFERFISNPFKIELIDSRKSIEQTKELLNNADCIHLMGGYTENQIELLQHFGINKESFKNAQVVFGTSAGAMALGPILIGTHQQNHIMTGLDCVPSIIWPHYSKHDDHTIQSLIPLVKRFVALSDDTGIRYERDDITVINSDYHIFK
ncbi:Type 1 glutamine amidotransferase-like domain-containing protein [Erysipelothrix urinaevulpis]|uniref:Type 1 glutamine amidotransferase-like domain-containing protein n=1 Tax=Erysipelothrix urinaevulpis TaxID=2683717 RepID=UPI00135C0BE7|nr:Type 1 glutamine amidotransferase-like domain-containing protein [Erysipelothrix urinaevulpis]